MFKQKRSEKKMTFKSWRTRMRRANRGLRAINGIHYGDYIKLPVDAQVKVIKFASHIGLKTSMKREKARVNIKRVNDKIEELK